MKRIVGEESGKYLQTHMMESASEHRYENGYRVQVSQPLCSAKKIRETINRANTTEGRTIKAMLASISFWLLSSARYSGDKDINSSWVGTSAMAYDCLGHWVIEGRVSPSLAISYVPGFGSPLVRQVGLSYKQKHTAGVVQPTLLLHFYILCSTPLATEGFSCRGTSREASPRSSSCGGKGGVLL